MWPASLPPDGSVDEMFCDIEPQYPLMEGPIRLRMQRRGQGGEIVFEERTSMNGSREGVATDLIDLKDRNGGS